MNTLHITPFPVLTTPRFLLRELKLTDSEQVFLLRSDARVNQFIDRPRATSIDDVTKFIEQIKANTIKGASVLWAIDQGGLLIGSICLWNISWQDATAEIGYELLPEYHGQGIMAEVTAVVVRYGFERLGLKSIAASIHPENARSIRLVERLGFLPEPHPEGGTVSDVFFRIQK